MGVIIPQVVTSDRATGAQVIDGSLKFDGSKSNRLTRTFGSAGNRTSWTWSCWTKRDKITLSNRQVIFGGFSASNNTDWLEIGWDNSADHVYWTSNGVTSDGTAQRRDLASWYHFFSTYDGSNLRIYVNNRLDLDYSVTGNMGINVAGAHYIGQSPKNAEDRHLDGRLSQCYFIDGQVLNPSDFAFTDPLTNTWKPKKYTGTFTGTNTFYLPFDGNSPIGQDKSGNGNDFTPVNFGGSLELDNPIVSGARPILNTLPGGTQAGVGVFGSKQNVGYAVTVYDDGGGNKYYIDGVKQDTVTGLIRGATYTFDTSDSTVSSHPFRFSATSNGSHGGGTEYTNGVAAITGAATTITVPYNAPETLYYYCTSHSGMGADITGITTNEKLADQYASNCTLAIPFVGNKEDVSVSIACTSTTGDVSNTNAVSSNNSSNFYSGSWYFDASGDYLTVPYSADSFNFGTGDFTVEAYVNQLARVNYTAIISSTNTSINVTNHWTLGYSNTADMLSFKLGSGGSSAVTANFSAHYGKWSHVAATRESGTIRLFFDGQEVASATDTSSLTGDTGNAVKIGQRYTNQDAYSFNGYMSDLRVYKGVAKYTSNFVPAAASPDILPDTPSGVAGGSKLTKITDGAVSFDGTGDYLTIAHNSDFDMYDSIYTWDLFFYTTDLSSGTDDEGYGTLFSQCTAGSSVSYGLGFDGSGNLSFKYWNGSSSVSTTATTKIGTNKWYHVAIVKDTASATSGNTKIFLDGKLEATTAVSGTFHNSTNPLEIGADRRSGGGSYDYFQGQISNLRAVKGTALYTSSFTPPTAPLTNVTNTKLLCCQSNKSSAIAAASPNISGSINDGTAWSSIVTGPTRKEDRVANAFNGSTSGPGAIAAYPGTLTFAPGLSSISSVKIYGYYAGSGVTLHVNGSAQSPSSGAFTLTISTSTLDSIVWTAIDGFNYMRIDAIEVDSTVLIEPVVGPDDSNESATNFNPFNTDINTVRGQESGYCTWNPLVKGPRNSWADSNATFSEGNLKLVLTGSGDDVAGTMTVDSGKWYYEVRLDTAANHGAGWTLFDDFISTTYSGSTGGIVNGDGHYGTAESSSNSIIVQRGTTSAATNQFNDGSTIGYAFDIDAGTMKIYVDGIFETTISSIPSGTYVPIFGDDSSTDAAGTANFGQKPFKFPPPDGFQPLNAANTRPETVISRPDQYVGVTTYTGSSGNVVVDDLNFKPDVVWIKQRNASGSTDDHVLVDSVRGRSKSLYPSETYSENTSDADKDLISFDINGFTLGPTQQSAVNRGSSGNYVAWTWKAGGNKNTFNVDDVGYASAAAAGLDGGTITPTGASVGTKQGFSIIQYQGNGSTDQTISHGLTQAPDFSIFKNMDGASNWTVFHRSVTTTTQKVFYLNTTGAIADYSGGDSTWWGTLPGASVFTIGATGTAINNGTNDIISYHWHDVSGLQKFGSYTGNGTADNGPFVELGFRPAVILIKRTTSGTGGFNWTINDSERNKYNPSGTAVFPNLSNQESTNDEYEIDFLSNGFKPRCTTPDSINVSGQTYIYAAWAEAPTVDLFGGGANAR